MLASSIVAENHGDRITIGLPRVAELDPILPVVISDAIHNMRAALDYIVYELAKHDSPSKAPDGTQFIIEDVKSDPLRPNRGFDVRKKQHLKLLSRDHVNMIEAPQPYNGVEWTKTLRDISNPDKHRTLTALTRSGFYGVTFAPRHGLLPRDAAGVPVADPTFSLASGTRYSVSGVVPEPSSLCSAPGLSQLARRWRRQRP